MCRGDFQTTLNKPSVFQSTSGISHWKASLVMNVGRNRSLLVGGRVSLAGGTEGEGRESPGASQLRRRGQKWAREGSGLLTSLFKSKQRKAGIGHLPVHPWPQERLSNTITCRHNKSTHTHRDKTQGLYTASIHHNVANKTWAINQAGKYWSIYLLVFLN